MEGFTLVDGIVLAVIVLSAVLAYARGLVRESLSIAGWIVAALAGFSFAPMVEPLIREIPVLRDVLGTSCELGILAGFAAVFVVALILVSLFTPLLAGAVQNSAIGPVDQGLGFLFGIVRGVLLVVIALVVYNASSAAPAACRRSTTATASPSSPASSSASPPCCPRTRRSGSPASTPG